MPIAQKTVGASLDQARTDRLDRHYYRNNSADRVVTLDEAYTIFSTGPVATVNDFQRPLELGAYALRYTTKNHYVIAY